MIRGLGAAPDDDPARLALARLFHAHSGIDEGFGRLRTRLIKGLENALRRGQELGAVRADLPLGLIVELTTAWLFSIDRWAADQRVTEPAEPTAIAADRALRILYTALAERTPS